MKKKLLSLLMVTALTASLVAGCGSNGDSKDKSSSSDRETKDVSELVIGEIEYSVIDDGGWAQSMHEGLVKACEDLGIDTKTNLLTMEMIVAFAAIPRAMERTAAQTKTGDLEKRLRV